MKISSAQKMILVIIPVVFLSACSTRWIYNQLDWLIPWYLNDYVTLQDFQEPQFDKALDKLLDWHRTTQLPKYAESLAKIENALNDPLSEQQINGFILEFESHFQTVFTQIGKQAVPLMLVMTPAQKSELLDNLQDKTADYAKDNLEIGIEESRLKTAQKMQEFLQDNLGYVTEEQKQTIKNWSINKSWMPPYFYQNRVAWREALQKIFSKTSDKQSADALMQLFTNRKAQWSEAFKIKNKENRQAMVEFIMQLQPSLETEQLGNLQKSLREWQSDFKQLANNQ